MLSCRPNRGLYYKGCVGPRPACFPNKRRVTMEPTSKETKVDYAAWIGVDWGSEKHAIVMQAANSSGVEQCVIKQTPEALQDWFLKVRSRFPGREVAIAIEQSKGLVINFLLGFDLVHVFRVNPK